MNDQVADTEESLTDAQRIDLATLLAEHLTAGNIEGFAGRVLGNEAMLVLIANRPPADELARSVVQALHEAACLQQAVTTLRLDVAANPLLTRMLNHILNGGRLSDLAGEQAIVQDPNDPFFDQTFQQLFPKVQRTICAIGLGRGINKLRGTGFLIGSNLVITNYHVIEPYITPVVNNGVENFVASESGEEIHCFFDYMVAPKPRFPVDPTRPHHSTHIRAIKDGWLRAARRKLRKEGIHPNDEAVVNQFDYAVIELEREMGRAPARASGGVLRGWLTLPRDIDYLGGENKRIVVAQHPEGAQQLYDIGPYQRLDASQTRVWYRVNTARGASGGAAVDKACQLYALHNAEVRGPDDKPLGFNQGVRIDKIASDLAGSGLELQPPPLDGDPSYWSLKDNLSDPKPVIGRDSFRSSIVKMIRPNGERIITVTGPPGSGRRFSIEFLERIVGPTVALAKCSVVDLQKQVPEAFLRSLLRQLGVGPGFEPIPEPKGTEMEPRWILDLPGWLSRVLTLDQSRRPSRYPAWIAINALADDGEQLPWDKWAENLPDLIAALTGSVDRDQAVDITQLRWLFVGNANLFPIGTATQLSEDLALQTQYVDEFVSCLQLAWRSVPAAKTIDEKFLRILASQYIRTAAKEKAPTRGFLANSVRNWVLEGLTGDV
jgi:V8-like Glu-specific endopeptidase